MELDATLRYDMNMQDYTKAGGDDHFISELSSSLDVPKEDISITSVKTGSVIISFKINNSGTGTLAEKQQQLQEIKAKLDEAVKTGALNAYPDAVILNYEAGVLVVSKFDLFFSVF